MEAFLIRLGTMSIQAAVVIAVVLFLRYLFAKLHVPKKYVMLLWRVPYICMICPWKISLPFSFWGSDDKVFSGVSHVAEQTEMLLHVDPAAQFSVEMMNPAQQVISEDVRIGQNTTGTLGSMAASEFLYISLFLVWLFGVLLLTGYSIYSYRKLKKRILCSIWMEENIYYADDIETAFVMGFLKQVIYLPSNMKKEHASYVIAHETTHIKRCNPLKKLVALAITCIHWFNPLAWVAFAFFGKDMEMTCDEETVARLGMESKIEYANALLQLSAPKGMLFHAPLAFGEGNTKGRIQNILKYKKAVWGVTALALVLIVVVAAGFLGKTYAVTTLGSKDMEQVAFPANRNVEVALLYGEGTETKFAVFPEAYGEIFIDFLENVKVERNPISKSRDEDRPSELMIRIGESDCYCFDAGATEVWYDDGVKPSYSYRVMDSEELLEFINRQIQSITEAEEIPVSETMETASVEDTTESEVSLYLDDSPYEISNVDATEISLDYADENIVVFHNYLGLFIYDWTGQKMQDSVALEPIGCNYTQGDNYCEVLVGDKGKTVYLHPLQEKEMYVYDLTTATLTKQEYNIEGIELFNDFGEKEKQLGWDPTVFQTINCVQVGEHRWIHLESGSGLLQDLAVVVTKDGKRETYLKVFGEE